MFLIMMLMLISLMMIYFKHPLMIGLLIFNQTILTCLITGLLSINYWYSYILFLIMIGGLLILFIYMTSIASNEKFKNYNLLWIPTFILLTFPIYLIDQFYLNLSKLPLMFKMTEEMNLLYTMNKYIMFMNNLTMILMIIYLFITLIAIVKITLLNYGPLRQKF